jgi:hypothetical protein
MTKEKDWNGDILAGEEGKNGGVRKKAGRPKGSKNIYSYESVKKLEQLGFDPIAVMVQQYEDLEELIKNSYNTKTGQPTHITAALKGTQQKITNDLMQYSYKKVPERLEQEVTTSKPMAVKLTLKGEKKDGKSKPEEVGES